MGLKILFVILCIFTFLCLYYLFDAIITSLSGSSSVFFPAKWKRKVPNTRLVAEAIQFTGFFLVEKKIKTYPTFKIYYYRHKRFGGVFNGKVIIYLGSNPEIPDLIDTCLHEVMHYVQSKTDKRYKEYDSFTKTMGYRDNPFEVEARAFASKYRDSCLEYLASKQIIEKS